MMGTHPVGTDSYGTLWILPVCSSQQTNRPDSFNQCSSKLLLPQAPYSVSHAVEPFSKIIATSKPHTRNLLLKFKFGIFASNKYTQSVKASVIYYKNKNFPSRNNNNDKTTIGKRLKGKQTCKV
jgi:hypothetical protein